MPLDQLGPRPVAEKCIAKGCDQSRWSRHLCKAHCDQLNGAPRTTD